MRPAYRLADAVGVLDNRFAFSNQLVDEPADAKLVVRIGPLQRGDLVVDEYLKLAGAASARSMPSPMAATSRRIAWLTVTTDSFAMFSGSASRSATSVMVRDTMRISWLRQISTAMPQNRITGPIRAIARPSR
jgi:hypothetical protein